MAKDLLLFVGQKAFIEKNGAVLILNDTLGLDFPGGKLQEGENDLTASLKREVSEETGLQIEVGEPFYTWYFDFKDNHKYAGKRVFLVGYQCKYKSGEIILSHEHATYKWVNKNNYQFLNDGSSYYKALDKYFTSFVL